MTSSSQAYEELSEQSKNQVKRFDFRLSIGPGLLKTRKQASVTKGR